ncbi:MAG: hypothetical protein AAF170_03175 [Bacteroidota bacterium]
MLPLIAALFVGLAPAASSPAPSAFSPTVSDSLTHYYAHLNTPAIHRLYRHEARTLRDRLMYRYRLFPLTMDDRFLENIPSDQGVRSARDLSLISALWAYKAANSSKIHLPTYGRRSERILNRALEIDPDEPYALLVKGQSLYYKPSWFGGDAAEAKRTFEDLRRVLSHQRVPGIHPFEAEVWIWMAVRKLDPNQGRALQRQLLARNPPPLFRQFLIDPP